MDTSSSPQSQPDVLDLIWEATPIVGPKPTPRKIAESLFREAERFQQFGLNRLLVDGKDTAVGVDTGRRTVPYRSLGLPHGTTVVHVTTVRVKYAESTSALIPGGIVQQWGILLLARDRHNRTYWLWSCVWEPNDGRAPSCRELSVDDLADLLTPVGEGEPVLNGHYVYMDLCALFSRKQDQLLRTIQWFGDEREGLDARRHKLSQLAAQKVTSAEQGHDLDN